MVHTLMNRSTALCVAGAFLAGLSVCELGLAGDDEGGSQGVSAAADLKLTNEVSNWTETPGSYAEYDVQGLYNIIDGGAQPHDDHGLIEGITQEMAGPSGRTAEIFVEDMGSAENATALFNYMAENNISQKVTFADFAQSAAIASQHLSGIQAYAHFGRYYISISFSGYTETQVAATDGNGFLKTYQNKIL